MPIMSCICFQCSVGWVVGRASSLCNTGCWYVDGGDLTCLTTITITTSIIVCCSKIWNGLSFWYWLIHVILEYWLLNRCCMSSFVLCLATAPLRMRTCPPVWQGLYGNIGDTAAKCHSKGLTRT